MFVISFQLEGKVCEYMQPAIQVRGISELGKTSSLPIIILKCYRNIICS